MNRTIIPPFLKQGSGIALIAPSRFAEKGHIELAEKWIQENGWVSYRSPHLGTKEDQFGGSNKQRSDDFNWAIAHVDVHAIWNVRGGYGAVKIVDNINWSALEKDPKWIIGFSDFTVLLSHSIQQNIAGIHAFMPIQIPSLSKKSLKGLVNTLAGSPGSMQAKHHPLNVNGQVTGKLIGGNLSVLFSLLGSCSFPQLDGCILVLEDLDEYKYHIDRMMNALRRSQVLQNLSGIVLGSFSEIKDNPQIFGKEVFEIIRENTPSNIPFGIGLPIGHTFNNESFINGLIYSLNVNVNGSLLIPIQ